MTVRWWSWRDRVAVLAGVLVPLVVCVVLVPFRAHVPNTDAALILVVAVVAVAAYGHRIAGVLASVFGGLWFDFFLTAPYERLSISDRHDVETAVLLLIVGTAVTELAVRGRRSRLLALTDEKYLEAIRTTNALVEAKAAQRDMTNHVCAQLCVLLGLRDCRFEAARFGGLLRLEADGQLRDRDRRWDVEQLGLPDHEVEMLASAGGRVRGRFVLLPVAGVVPTLAARRCAVIVVGQAATALP